MKALVLALVLVAPINLVAQPSTWRLQWVQPGASVEDATSYIYRIRWDEGPWIVLTKTCEPGPTGARCTTEIPAAPTGTRRATIYAENSFGEVSPPGFATLGPPAAPTDLKRVIVIELP